MFELIVTLVILAIAIAVLIIDKYEEFKENGKYAGYADEAILFEAIRYEWDCMNIPLLLLILVITFALYIGNS